MMATIFNNVIFLQCCEFSALGFTFNAMSMNLECKIEEHARVGFALELGMDSTDLNNQFVKLSKKCFFLIL
jgi:hypothetical protein